MKYASNWIGLGISLIIHIIAVAFFISKTTAENLNNSVELPININMFVAEIKPKPKQKTKPEPKIIKPEPGLKIKSKSKFKSKPKRKIELKLKKKVKPKKKIESKSKPKPKIKPKLKLNQNLINIALATREKYKEKVLRLIQENKFFPKRARKMRKGGNVKVEFSLNRNGNIINLKTINSSGPSSLKKAALKTIRKSAPFPKFPDEVKKQYWEFKTTIEYKFK